MINIRTHGRDRVCETRSFGLPAWMSLEPTWWWWLVVVENEVVTAVIDTKLDIQLSGKEIVMTRKPREGHASCG